MVVEGSVSGVVLLEYILVQEVGGRYNKCWLIRRTMEGSDNG